MSSSEILLRALRHDLHKVGTPGALPHKDALVSETAQRSDVIAAWFSRNCMREPFRRVLFRKSLVFPAYNPRKSRELVSRYRQEITHLFEEGDVHKLHTAILRSKLLNLYSEARNFPYTSLKYHILLVCALTYNFLNGSELKDLYLYENVEPAAIFQIIYEDSNIMWALMPRKKGSLSRLHPKFYVTWERRLKLSLGGEFRDLDGLLSTIGSWSLALATLEDFVVMVER
ncbi:MAG: hypothetical protein ACTSRC_20610 [Candidatus Helarchaeota archaeon]